MKGVVIFNCKEPVVKTKVRYKISYNNSFGYSATWRKSDRQKNIDKLKETCLEHMRKSFKYLSELPDDKLLEILEEQEWDE